MASWIIPALKAVLPHVKTIYDTAAPVFTKKKVEGAPEPARAEQREQARGRGRKRALVDHGRGAA